MFAESANRVAFGRFLGAEPQTPAGGKPPDPRSWVGTVCAAPELRHFNATELISAGVDVRTVAGRLGHADGGTTLKYHSASTKEADQRASAALARLLPLASNSNNDSAASSAVADQHARPATYLIVARDLRHDIATGHLPCGATVPSTGEITTLGHRTTVAPRAGANWPPSTSCRRP